MDLNLHISKLYSSYQKELNHYVGQKFGIDSSEAEDIVQQTFTKYSELPDAKQINNPRAYLYKIAHNQAVDLKRRNFRFDKLIEEPFLKDKYNDDTLYDPVRIQIAKQHLKILQSTINKMPYRRRLFLKQSRYENLSNVEIAHRAGVSEAAVRKHIAIALTEIKHAIDRQDNTN